MATLIFGKVFASMFTGSMYGAGAHVFAVMTYVIANMQPSKERVEYVRLNPKFLAGVIGEKESRIQEAIDYLCDKDGQTNSPGEDGKRLVLESPFVYRVVNGQHYRELKDEEDRLQKDAVRSQRYRERQTAKKKGKPLDGETAAVNGYQNGNLDKDFQPVIKKPSTKAKIEQIQEVVEETQKAVDYLTEKAMNDVPHGTSPAESQGDAQGDAGLRMALARKRDEKSTGSPEPSNGVTFTRPT